MQVDIHPDNDGCLNITVMVIAVIIITVMEIAVMVTTVMKNQSM